VYDKSKCVHLNMTAVLTDRSFLIQNENMIRFGNKPTHAHRAALKDVLDLYSKLAFGETTGRFAVPLGTGLGKTMGIISWITALHQLGHDHISVAVCASQVESLCDIKRALINNGVPEERIGLWHSYPHDPIKTKEYLKGDRPDLKGFASLPSTTDHRSKQILLVTHSRLRGKGSIDEYNTHEGKPRNLILWDESLFLSDCMSVEEWRLNRATNWLNDTPGHNKELVHYLKHCLWRFKEEKDNKQVLGRGADTVIMPYLTNQQLDAYEESIPQGFEGDTIRAFLSMSHYPLRIFESKESGLITYNPVINPDLKNIVVLDASFPIRKLERLNPDIKVLGASNASLVSYENVKIHQLLFHSGRGSMEKHLTKLRRTDDGALKDVIDVIIKTSQEEAILLFTFKTRDKRFDYISDLKKALRKHGIDPDQMILVKQGYNETYKRRINFLTWGNETSLNRYSYCSTVIFAGVLHRSRTDLASHYVGQLNDIYADIDPKELQDIENSEICHCLYQAMSRGSCRIIENGKAKSMNVWLIHRYDNIRPVINEVMPRVKWRKWHPRFIVLESKVKSVTKKIIKYLNSLSLETNSISTQKIKKGLKMKDVPRATFSRALKEEDIGKTGWLLLGRSLIRGKACFA